MSHYSCKQCWQRYDDCVCPVVNYGYLPPQDLNRTELEIKVRKQYNEIKEIALLLGINLE